MIQRHILRNSRWALLPAFLVLFLHQAATAAGTNRSGFGVGFMVGEPTGISMKMWATGTTALQFGVGWSLRGDAIWGHADYLIHNFDLIRPDIPFYFGIGGKLVAKDEAVIGARVPVGLNFLPKSYPIDVFIEIVPGLNLMPETEFDVGGGVGIRYFF